jgi:hypothetical protein
LFRQKKLEKKKGWRGDDRVGITQSTGVCRRELLVYLTINTACPFNVSCPTMMHGGKRDVRKVAFLFVACNIYCAPSVDNRINIITTYKLTSEDGVGKARHEDEVKKQKQK